MRRVLALALALAFSGCNCSRQPGETRSSGPELAVVTPEKTGDEYVLDFGQVRAGASYTQNILLENRGRANLTLASAQLREGSNPNFSLGGAKAPNVLEPGQQFLLTVTYAPLAAESAAGFVDIGSDDGAMPQLAVRLQAQAVAAKISVCLAGPSPLCNGQVAPKNLSVDFGLLAINSTAKQQITVSNAGAIDLNLSSVALRAGPEFSLRGAPVSAQVIPVGGSIGFEVAYTPKDGGYDPGVIEVASDDPANPTVRIDLKGGGDAPKLCPSPARLDFGQIVVNTTAQKPITLTNCGSMDLHLSAIALNAASSTYYSIAGGGAVPLTLPPGASQDVLIKYAPKSLGTHGGRLDVSSDGGGGGIPIAGSAVAQASCQLDASPTVVDFGNVSNNGFSEKAVTVSNKGTLPCNWTTLTGPTAGGSFSLRSGPTLPVVLNPGVSQDLLFRFTPTGGAATDTVTLTSDDPVNPSLALTLKGTGVAAPPCDLQLVPGSVSFGAVSVGASKTATVSLHNFGSGTCFVVSGAIGPNSSAAFSAHVTNGFVPNNLASGGQMDFAVSFAPASGGSHSGTLNVTGGETIWAQKTISAPLSGLAGSPGLCISPSNPQELDFGAVGAGTAKDLSFTLTSCGAGIVEVRGLFMDMATSPAFSFPSKPAMPLSIAPGSSVQVVVHYAPTAAGGDLGRVTILSNDPAKPKNGVNLRGNLVPGCQQLLPCRPSSLDYPKTPIGQVSTLTFTCTNVGSAPVTASQVRLGAGSSAQFTVLNKGLPATLAPGDSIRVAVDYAPTAAATNLGTVEVLSDDCQSPTRTVALNATGVPDTYPACIPPKVFQPIVKWEWSSAASPTTVMPDFKIVNTTTIVVNLTDDNGDGRIDTDDIPDVVFSSYSAASIAAQDLTPPGILRAVHGGGPNAGKEIWNVTDPALRVNADAQIAAGDIDGDNKVELIVPMYYESPGTGTFGMQGRYVKGRLLCFGNDGVLKWMSDFWSRSPDEMEDGSGASIADLNGDGIPEIILGASVFDNTGRLLWHGSGGEGMTGHGPFSTVADLDGDGQQEVIAGNTAYKANGQIFWQYGGADGYAIVLDIDKDGVPDVVLRNATDKFVVLSNLGAVKLGPVKLPTDPIQTMACPSLISAADFDKDGFPDLAIPTGDKIFVIKKDGSILWQQPITDDVGQCGASGAAAFDFEGDGEYEVVYHDQYNMFVFRGSTGQIVYQTPRQSSTIFETPVIADVDNDGHADILMTQTNGGGVKALSNLGNDWVATRRIWNEANYHITNVAESGAIPRVEPPSWTKFNSYRANEPHCK